MLLSNFDHVNMIIDTHSHLTFAEYESDIDQVIERAKGKGVFKMIVVGCELKACDDAVKMIQKYDCLYATLGLHPYDCLDANEELMEKWEKLIKENKRIVGIGECGLDYFKAKISKADQAKGFKIQLKLAQKVGLPVVVHARDADDEAFKILDEFMDVKAVFHCFSSNLEFAKKLWDRGYMTSFTGIVTYPTAEAVREVVRNVPMDKFMVETDCPYLAPQAFRGQRNEPSYVTEVVKMIAELKGMSFEEVSRISTENAERFFKI